MTWQPFNELNPAQAKRLAILAEEMGEAIQVIGKILRHGYESRHPNGGMTNRQLLEKELGDVQWAMIFLCEAGDLSKTDIHACVNEKSVTVTKYLHEQDAS